MRPELAVLRALAFEERRRRFAASVTVAYPIQPTKVLRVFGLTGHCSDLARERVHLNRREIQVARQSEARETLTALAPDSDDRRALPSHRARLLLVLPRQPRLKLLGRPRAPRWPWAELPIDVLVEYEHQSRGDRQHRRDSCDGPLQSSRCDAGTVAPLRVGAVVLVSAGSSPGTRRGGLGLGPLLVPCRAPIRAVLAGGALLLAFLEVTASMSPCAWIDKAWTGTNLDRVVGVVGHRGPRPG